MHPPRTDDPEPADEGVSNEGVSHSSASRAPEETIAYWTPERMAGAKPREVRLAEPVASPDDDAEAD